MPAFKFTQEAIAALRPPPKGRVYFWDTSTPGFGIRVSALGKRVWVAQYRVDGRSVMETIAPFTDLPSLDEARTLAMESRLAARKGVNLIVERRKERETERVAKATNAAKLAAEKAAVAEKLVTIEQVADRYLREYCARNLGRNTLNETHRMFQHDIFPQWAKRPLTEITRRDVEHLLEYKAANRERLRRGVMSGGSPIMANRHLSKLKTFFGWCLRKELITTNPALGVDKLVKEIARDRVLEDREVVAFWHATENVCFPYGEIVRLLLLTGQRRSEVAGMRWDEIDMDKSQWAIPRERVKNGKQHFVHLSAPALTIINSLPNQSELLFPSSRASNVPVGFAKMKHYLDAGMSHLLGKPVKPWVIHDLRRTAASGMAQLGIAPHVVDRVLNHTAGSISGVAAIYNRFQYLEERRDALDAWALRVEQLVGANVKRVVVA